MSPSLQIQQQKAKRRAALWVGAVAWLLLLGLGFVLPQGWVALAGSSSVLALSGLIGLWAITLVVVPLVAGTNPLRRHGATDLYVVGMLAMLLGTFLTRWRTELPAFINVGVPVTATLSASLVVWAYWGSSQNGVSR